MKKELTTFKKALREKDALDMSLDDYEETKKNKYKGLVLLEEAAKEPGAVSDKFEWMERACILLLNTARLKNHDYTADATEWYENFRKCGLFGMLARLEDKVRRLETLLLQPGYEGAVNESLEDTLMDLATYALLMKGALSEGLPLFGDMTPTVENLFDKAVK